MVGEGTAIEPVSGASKMVAPCEGVITLITGGNHAFVVKTDSGTEILVQVGLETAGLKGEGFKRVAKQGARVKVGDPVLEFDLGVLEEHGKSPLCPVVVQNMDKVKEVAETSLGNVTAGESEIMRVSL